MNTTNFERIIGFIASIITIAQLIVALPSLFGVSVPSFLIRSGRINVTIRVVIITMLEVSFAYAFGYLFAIACKAGERALVLLCFCIISIISAWVSIFNLQYILWNEQVKGTALFGFYPVLFVTAILNALFVGVKLDILGPKNEGLEPVSLIFLGTAYVILSISLMFQ